SFFGIDDQGGRTWVDPHVSDGGHPPTFSDVPYADLTLTNGLGSSSIDFHGQSTPDGAGSEASLANQATAALANFYDTTYHSSFVAWYVYERNLTDTNGDLGSTPYDAQVLADLIKQVHDAYDQ